MATGENQGNEWLRWFPAPSGNPRLPYCVRRFEQLDVAGKPVGKPITSQTPAGAPRLFPNELRAQWAADELNRMEGR